MVKEPGSSDSDVRIVFDPLTAQHPEKNEHEVFLGNFSRESIEQLEYTTKRMGNVALDISGQPVIFPGKIQLFPVFVARQEYESVQHKQQKTEE